ncbi:hypothetical protein U9M48_021925 [Paspalum notatum var. saurae]|uniref:Uncharacterized protein n=1 Tax=Paspalum notatum var. saurae TaxID=547442 RepID=A0AAQ3TKP0_PASNO
MQRPRSSSRPYLAVIPGSGDPSIPSLAFHPIARLPFWRRTCSLRRQPVVALKRPMGYVDLHLKRLWSKRGRGGAAAMVRFPRGYSQQNDHVLLPSMRVVAGVTVVLDLRGMEQEEGPTFVHRSLQLSSQASMT